MKKKLFLGMLSLMLVIFIITGFLSLDLQAAICKPKDGSGTCEGQCCLTLISGGCIAGPCDKIFG